MKQNIRNSTNSTLRQHIVDDVSNSDNPLIRCDLNTMYATWCLRSVISNQSYYYSGNGYFNDCTAISLFGYIVVYDPVYNFGVLLACVV